ncbi:DegT/DnrJ/EryC1/StrS aminotransferase family protein [Sphingobacterium spiritivorum ATCC 33300]|uniref:GDP-perosamine synthase n=1 Tax=Sphingobacterium spiritivorum ATCC 33300 TaxID=525372 RepID=C2G0X0_SPHSI|nr:LegC family aminotransferase [Sphingobacterium spiritivorum]EEI91200.1 DegT/DnrJ/EryC1/StrS aminotransferase family protein [Sphingobacterium spiritivorum ATCC 33300]QQS97590.1 LegC family aminotransferase [Sphingobacterium spiritivorum]
MQSIDNIISFIRDQYKTDKFIPLHEPRFRGNEKKYVVDTIDSTFVSSVGAYVDKFEEMMQAYTGAEKAVAVVNGTASLQVALRLAGVKAGDEVITQALTFIATANAIVYNHATPIFVDVDLDTMGLSPKALSFFLEEFGELREDGCYNKSTGNRIAACMPMHTFGFPVHLDELLAVCDKWNIPLVEDAAESLGSYYKGKHTGTLGLVSGFSFNGNKTITCGGGGALITNDLELGKHAKYLTTTAKRPHPYEFFHDELGYNFRMPNLNAALACAQMEVLESFLADKRQMADEYAALFSELGIKFRKETPDTKANYWLMCVELNDKMDREDFLKYTNENGVMTRPIWNLMYRLPMYEHCQRDSQRNAEFLEERIVNIPSSVR